MKKNKLYLFIFFAFVLVLLNGCKPKTIMVTFDSAGGTQIETLEIKKGEIALKPVDPIKDGYQFLGWYLDETLFDFSTKVKEDINLVAKWQIITYTVTFESNGGSSVLSQNVNANGLVQKPVNPIKVGYDFIGWYLNDEKFDFNNKINSNLTLYAKWETAKDTSLLVGKWVGSEILDNQEILYQLLINNDLSGRILVIKDNDLIESELLKVESKEGKFAIAFSLTPSNIVNLELDFDNNNLVGNGIYSKSIIFRNPKSYTITYHNYDKSTSQITVDELDKFEVKDCIGLDDDSLVFEGWYTEDGQYYSDDIRVISNMEVYPNIYTDGLIFDENQVLYYAGASSHVVLPKYYNGMKITTIDQEAFLKNKLTHITFSDTIENVERYAFSECVYLEEVHFNEGLKIVDEYAFYLSINLKNVTLPTTLETIGMFAFSFTNIEEVTFPKNIKQIDSYAYHACNNLKEVTFLSEIPCEIGDTIFTYVDDDMEIVYPNFPIWVPQNSDVVPYELYREDLYLREYGSLIFPIDYKGQTGYIVDDDILLGYIDEDSNNPIVKIDIPSGVVEIADFAFYNKINIETINMPEGFEKIGKYAFYNCTSVANLYMSKTLKEIDDYAFTGFFVGNNISRLYFPEGFKRIGEGAFMSSFNLRIVELPSTLEYIGYLAFGMSNSLERIYFSSTLPPKVGTFTNDKGEVITEIFEIINPAKTIMYVPFGKTIDNKNVVDVYKETEGYKNFAEYIKAKPEGQEVGHYGDGELFIDLDGCDRATIYKVVECEVDTSQMGGTKYEYQKEIGTYQLNGIRLEMSFETYGTITAIYGNRQMSFTLDNKVYKLVEPKRYYDNYNWTNFVLYDNGTKTGKGMFDMYGSFLTPFEWSIDNDVFFIKIDGNNKKEENKDYIGIVEYTGTYDKENDTFSVEFLLNDYIEMTSFVANREDILYATGEVTRLYGTYKAYADNNKDYAMFTLISYGNGIVDVYIGENGYFGCTYTVENDVVSINLQTLIITLEINKDGNLSGSFTGVDTFFVYEDELLDSTKLPTYE